MTNAYPGMPKIRAGINDVRDCAQAHLNAIKIDGAKGQRFILASCTLWFREMAEILNEGFPEHKIKHHEMKYCLIKIGSIFDKNAGHIIP